MQINIPQRLKAVRESRKLNQEKVANGIGIKRSTYASYEEGRATPSIQLLIQLAFFYDFNSLDQLLGISIEEEKNTDKSSFSEAYHAIDPERRKIVDFVLNLNY